MTSSPFIALEGIDGAGKTTQCRLLADWLAAEGRPLTVCREPGGTPVGDRIRELLLDVRSDVTVLAEVFLYLASRSQLVEQVIQPALAQGRVVLTDRYMLSTIVYQGHAGGIAPETLRDLGRIATGGLTPELTLILDLPETAARQRKSGPTDRMESKGMEFLARVWAGFRHEALRDPARIRVIDAGRPVAEVHDEIRREVRRVLEHGPRP